MAEFLIESDEFKPSGFLSKDHESNQPAFGGNGKNLSPALRWEGVPTEAKSLALTVYDPDAPTGSGFWHWIVVNLPVDLRALPQNAGHSGGSFLPPSALQLKNDYGLLGFGGCAPPRGDPPHHYIFKLHALKVEQLELSSDTPHAIARFMIHQNEIASASVTGLYQLQ